MNRAIIFIVSVFFSGSFYVDAAVKKATVPRSAAHQKEPARHNVSENIFSSDVKELTSGEGIKFWFMKDGSAPLIHVKIAFKYSGACYQEKAKAGVPIFYSNAVFCGSGKYSKTQLAEKFSNLSVAVRSGADFDNLYFHLTIPKIVLNEAVSIVNDLITSPRFESDKVGVIQDEIASYLQNYAVNAESIASHSMMPSLIFKSHGYESGMFGSIENFMQLSVEDLKNYRSKFLTTSNAEICVFGDVSENEAISLIDNIFLGVEKGKPSSDNLPDVAPKLNSEIKKYYAEGPQSLILFALKTERPKSDKRQAALVLYRILGEGSIFRGKILSKLRTERGLIYSGAVSHVDWNHSSYILGKLRTDNSKVQDAINLLKIIVEDLRKNGIGESELQFAKKNIKGNILVNLRTSGNLCDFYFNRKLCGLGANALSELIEKINQVKLEDVNSLAKEILDENNMSFIVIGGKE